LRTIVIPAAMLLSLPAAPALAGDAANGRLLAASHCAVCHAVAPGQRNEVATAPPFEAIARSYGANEGAIVLAIMGPHPRMNFVPRREDAEHIAAYIATLPR
jgi:mono/diheme cytochrome c family protein